MSRLGRGGVIDLSAESCGWQGQKAGLEFSLGEGFVSLKSANSANEYLIKSRPITMSSGLYSISTNVNLKFGAVTIGVIDSVTGSWIANISCLAASEHCLSFSLNRKREVQVLVASCSFDGASREVECVLSKFIVRKTGGLLKYWNQRVKQSLAAAERKLYSSIVPSVYKSKLKLNIALRRLFCRLPFSAGFGISSAFDIGYACRAIHVVEEDGKKYVLLANTGQGTLTILDDAGTSRHTVSFGPMSAPISLASFQREGRNFVTICLFNFDVALKDFKSSDLLLIPFGELLSNEAFSDIAESAVLSRAGCCGFRAVQVKDRGEEVKICAIDRDQDIFYRLIVGKSDLNVLDMKSFRLPQGTEPIGFAEHAAGSNEYYYLNSRNRKALQVLAFAGEGFSLIQTVSINDFSRSSVCLAHVKKTDKASLVMALWGGDPKKLNTITQGSLMVADITSTGAVCEPEYFPGGIHPTDVVAADFDSDGLDEIVLLNYGNGLNHDLRSNFGSLMIFKWRKGILRLEKKINIPSPRIAAVNDIDGDGRPELLVSLFFESKCVIIDHR